MAEREDKRMKKKIIAIAVAGALLFGGTGVLAASNLKSWINPLNKADKIDQTDYPVYINGKLLEGVKMDSNGKLIGIADPDPKNKTLQPVLGYNGRTYLPLRSIAEALGADSNKMWDTTDPKNPHVDIETPVKTTGHQYPTDYIQANIFPNSTNISYVSVKKALQTNPEIEAKAKELTGKYAFSETSSKADAIINWIANHMTFTTYYLEQNDTTHIGAISAFNSGEGVCYDYACLFMAMADAAGMNVRLILGEAYVYDSNIKQWTLKGHAWVEWQNSNGLWYSADPTWQPKGNPKFGSELMFNPMEVRSPADVLVKNGRYSMQMAAEYLNY